MDRKRRIPLVLVTGFLGSGKTTLVRYLLENLDQDLRVGIVQNEYASANIDTTELQRVDRKFEVLEVTAVMHCPRLLAVRMAHVLERWASPKTQRRFLRLLMAFERLSSWPTRFLTGYLVAVRAIRK